MPNLLVERIGWTLIHSVWEGLLVALVLAVGLVLARRKSANLRYGMACAALVTLAVLPVATFWATQPVESVAVERQTLSGTQRVVSLAPATLVRPIDIAVQPFLPGLVLGWGLGATLLSLRLLGAFAQVQRLRRRGRPVSVEWESLFHEAIGRIGVKSRVKLLMSDRIQIPCAVGVLRAVVILPTEMLTRLPSDYIQALMLHELAHVRRHDYLVNLLQSILETLLFYHPAVWWVSRVVRDEREHCCDDIAARAFGDPVRYAHALTRLEEQRKALPRFSLAANGGTLLARIQRLLGIPTQPRFAHSAWPLAAIFIFTIAATSTAMQAPTVRHTTTTHQSHQARKPSKSDTNLAAKPAQKAIGDGTKSANAGAIGTLHNLFAVRTVTSPASTSTNAAISPNTVAAKASTSAKGAKSALSTGIRKIAGSGTHGEAEQPKIVDLGNGCVSVSLTKSWASDSIMALAKAAKMPVLLGDIEDKQLTINLPECPDDDALVMMVTQANLVLRRDGRTCYIESKSKEPESTYFDPQHISMKCDGMDLRTAAMALAKASGRSIVVTPGNYGTVTLSLNNVPFEEALPALSKAAEHATYRTVGSVVFFLFNN